MGDRVGSKSTSLTIVVDVGSATHGGDTSIEPLIEQFEPDELYGFDPQQKPGEYQLNGTKVKLQNVAAWVTTGRVSFVGSGLGGRISEDEGEPVECIDLAVFLEHQLERGGVTLKLDAEGSEYQIVDKLVKLDLDERLDELLVEWHCPWCGHGIWSHAEACEYMEEAEQVARDYEARLRCKHVRWEL